MTDKKHYIKTPNNVPYEPNLTEDFKSRPKLPAPTLTRLYAARAVQLVIRDGVTLEAAFDGQAGYSDLDPRDRAFARLIAATVFRRWGQIGAVLKPMLKDKPPAFIMSVLQTACAQILFLDTGQHAAVGESVNVVKSSSKTRGFAGLVNAVLRRVTREGPKIAATMAPSENFPRWLSNSWTKAYGRQALRKMALQLMKDPPLDISVVSDTEGWAEKLDGTVLPTGSIRKDRIGNVTELPGFETGAWWAQDIAASLPVKLLARALGDDGLTGKTVLDLCAAPGGKTMQLCAMGADVTAVDKSDKRLDRLRQNLERTGQNAQIVVEDVKDFMPEGADPDAYNGQFDAVLLDAPCSATGTFRRHPDVLFNKSHTDIGKLGSLQNKLLLAAARHVKPGGHLIYCTCSLQTEEGEARIAPFLAARSDFRLNPILTEPDLDDLQVVTQEGYVRSLPHYLLKKGGMDGFFIARLQRTKEN
ncbi:RsmB/NOP family class I SAM-dependent RNA methyltransferase [Fretibacter rubidus]|uniref:RsmB/NOP family class I SAM-dependent RNA methyltransferase n=1 Tax=Fretibacter rubidus TaxID=570162 RepID=UPI00352B1C57